MVLYVPGFGHGAKSPLFYGDTLPSDHRHRARMAKRYHLAEVRIGKPHRVAPGADKEESRAQEEGRAQETQRLNRARARRAPARGSAANDGRVRAGEHRRGMGPTPLHASVRRGRRRVRARVRAVDDRGEPGRDRRWHDGRVDCGGRARAGGADRAGRAGAGATVAACSRTSRMSRPSPCSLRANLRARW